MFTVEKIRGILTVQFSETGGALDNFIVYILDMNIINPTSPNILIHINVVFYSFSTS